MHLYGFQGNNSPSSPLGNMLFGSLVELIDTVNILFLFAFLKKLLGLTLHNQLVYNLYMLYMFRIGLSVFKSSGYCQS